MSSAILNIACTIVHDFLETQGFIETLTSFSSEANGKFQKIKKQEIKKRLCANGLSKTMLESIVVDLFINYKRNNEFVSNLRPTTAPPQSTQLLFPNTSTPPPIDDSAQIFKPLGRTQTVGRSNSSNVLIDRTSIKAVKESEISSVNREDVIMPSALQISPAAVDSLLSNHSMQNLNSTPQILQPSVVTPIDKTNLSQDLVKKEEIQKDLQNVPNLFRNQPEQSFGSIGKFGAKLSAIEMPEYNIKGQSASSNISLSEDQQPNTQKQEMTFVLPDNTLKSNSSSSSIIEDIKRTNEDDDITENEDDFEDDFEPEASSSPQTESSMSRDNLNTLNKKDSTENTPMWKIESKSKDLVEEDLDSSPGNHLRALSSSSSLSSFHPQPNNSFNNNNNNNNTNNVGNLISTNPLNNWQAYKKTYGSSVASSSPPHSPTKPNDSKPPGSFSSPQSITKNDGDKTEFGSPLARDNVSEHRDDSSDWFSSPLKPTLLLTHNKANDKIHDPIDETPLQNDGNRVNNMDLSNSAKMNNDNLDKSTMQIEKPIELVKGTTHHSSTNSLQPIKPVTAQGLGLLTSGSLSSSSSSFNSQKFSSASSSSSSSSSSSIQVSSKDLNMHGSKRRVLLASSSSPSHSIQELISNHTNVSPSSFGESPSQAHSSSSSEEERRRNPKFSDSYEYDDEDDFESSPTRSLANKLNTDRETNDDDDDSIEEVIMAQNASDDLSESSDAKSSSSSYHSLNNGRQIPSNKESSISSDSLSQQSADNNEHSHSLNSNQIKEGSNSPAPPSTSNILNLLRQAAPSTPPSSSTPVRILSPIDAPLIDSAFPSPTRSSRRLAPLSVVSSSRGLQPHSPSDNLETNGGASLSLSPIRAHRIHSASSSIQTHPESRSPPVQIHNQPTTFITNASTPYYSDDGDVNNFDKHSLDDSSSSESLPEVIPFEQKQDNDSDNISMKSSSSSSLAVPKKSTSEKEEDTDHFHYLPEPLAMSGVLPKYIGPALTAFLLSFPAKPLSSFPHALALSKETVDGLKTIIFGSSGLGEFPESWRQSFRFRSSSYSPKSSTPFSFCLIQNEGGPCAVVAGVQARMVSALQQHLHLSREKFAVDAGEDTVHNIPFCSVSLAALDRVLSMHQGRLALLAIGIASALVDAAITMSKSEFETHIKNEGDLHEEDSIDFNSVCIALPPSLDEGGDPQSMSHAVANLETSLRVLCVPPPMQVLSTPHETRRQEFVRQVANTLLNHPDCKGGYFGIAGDEGSVDEEWQPDLASWEVGLPLFVISLALNSGLERNKKDARSDTGLLAHQGWGSKSKNIFNSFNLKRVRDIILMKEFDEEDGNSFSSENDDDDEFSNFELSGFILPSTYASNELVNLMLFGLVVPNSCSDVVKAENFVLSSGLPTHVTPDLGFLSSVDSNKNFICERLRSSQPFEPTNGKVNIDNFFWKQRRVRSNTWVVHFGDHFATLWMDESAIPNVEEDSKWRKYSLENDNEEDFDVENCLCCGVSSAHRNTHSSSLKPMPTPLVGSVLRMVFIDALGDQTKPTILTVWPHGMTASAAEQLILDDLQPSLEKCIRSIWPCAKIDWNGEEPFL